MLGRPLLDDVVGFLLAMVDFEMDLRVGCSTGRIVTGFVTDIAEGLLTPFFWEDCCDCLRFEISPKARRPFVVFFLAAAGV